MQSQNVDVTEGWAVIRGMEWAWRTGRRKVEIRTDSRELVKWIEGRKLPRGPLRNIIEECRKWKNMNWDIRIKHIYREQNEVADFVAKAAARGNDQWKDLSEPLPGSENILSNDQAGLLS